MIYACERLTGPEYGSNSASALEVQVTVLLLAWWKDARGVRCWTGYGEYMPNSRIV